MTSDNPFDDLRNLSARISAEIGVDVHRAVTEVGRGLTEVQHIIAAQAAVLWAYRGDLKQLHHALDTMEPERLRQLSAVAALLVELADEELATR